MARGLFIAVATTVLWVSAQLFLAHAFPTPKRFRAMALGFFLSLPLVYVGYRYLHLPGGLDHSVEHEAWVIGLINAHLLHLLLFFFYVECFYHVERSVTLRLLLEILRGNPEGVKVEDLQDQYPLRQMIRRRLRTLRANGYVEEREGRWHNRPKGALFALTMAASAWVFQSKSQKERIGE